MAHLVFVYGTLKEGFPNFRVNRGTRLAGAFATLARLPLYLVGERHVPWLVDDPGQGERVEGEVYAVDDGVLEQMDVLEGVASPEGYRRRRIAVVPLVAPPAASAPDAARVALADSGTAIDVHAYLKDTRQLADAGPRSGPFPAYTAAHAALYRPRA